MKALLVMIALSGVAGGAGVGHADGSNYQLPTMTEVPHERVPPLTVPPPEPEADHRPMFIGAGIIALAGLAWWGARRRARIDDEEDPDER